MTSMAFIVPLHRIRRSYKRRITIPLANQLPFVHDFNADFRYYSISGHNPLATPDYTLFYYNSNEKNRSARVYTYLIRYRIGRNQPNSYAIVLVAEVDKVFKEDHVPFNADSNFCTPDDIVYLKRAFYETGETGLFTNDGGRISLHDWLINLVAEVSGRMGDYWRNSTIAGSVVNINVQYINVNTCISKCELDDRFTDSYYGIQAASNNAAVNNGIVYLNQIQDFLQRNIVGMPSPLYSFFYDMERFVYGLLYANDNFARAHDNAVQIVDDIYSNNVSEQYWAVRGNIVFIKTASPFVNVCDRERQALNGEIRRINCLLELCMCLSLDRDIRSLHRRYLNMKPQEIESQRAAIAECFNDSIYNLQELDERKDFFIRRFGLRQRFDDLVSVVQPRISLMDRLFNRSNMILSIIIATLTFLVTFLTILK